jgi:hypothetical protein
VADKSTDESPTSRSRSSQFPIAALRSRLGQVIWLVCVVCALFLAIGALLIALDANQDNSLVSFILGGADAVDLGMFSREDGIKEFGQPNSDVKNALFNWGLGAVFWLVVGRILDRLVRP